MKMVVPEKSVDLLMVFVVILLIAVGAFAVMAGANLLQLPGHEPLDFIGRMFEFFGNALGIFGNEAGKWFCERDLKETLELCKISASQLEDYCKMAEEEKIGVCRLPPDGMAEFCKMSWNDRERWCNKQNQYMSGCDQVKKQANPTGIDTELCKMTLSMLSSFCYKSADLQVQMCEIVTNGALCGITASELSEYCKMTDTARSQTCRNPTDEMKAFCVMSQLGKDIACMNQDDFISQCKSPATEMRKFCMMSASDISSACGSQSDFMSRCNVPSSVTIARDMRDIIFCK